MALPSGGIVSERLRIVRIIGHGGMGDVYAAEDTAHSKPRRVALKTICPEIASNREIVQQFEREIEIVQTITHPNVYRVYERQPHRYQDEDGSRSGTSTMFLTMELLEGSTLNEHLQKIAPHSQGWPEERLVRIVASDVFEHQNRNIIGRACSAPVKDCG
jgi:serine/threonine protein kinase